MSFEENIIEFDDVSIICFSRGPPSSENWTREFMIAIVRIFLRNSFVYKNKMNEIRKR